MTLDPGAPGGSGWTFGLSPVVSAMLSGVVDACVACMASCLLPAPRCVSTTRFFAWGGILGHSDILIGPPVFLLGGKKVISLLVSVGLLSFSPTVAIVLSSWY